MLNSLNQSLQKWMFRPTLEHGTVTLTQRRIFILPTWRGVGFAFLLLLMLVGDINYNLSLGYVLTFLLSSMAVMSMLHAFRNMAQLQVQAGYCEPVFAGETAQFVFYFHNHNNLPRYQLTLKNIPPKKNTPSNKKYSLSETTFDVAAQQNLAVHLALPTTTRGWLSSGKLTLYTEFPLGLFHAWSYLHFDTQCLVYPAPAAPLPLPVQLDKDGQGTLQTKGDEDFAGVRGYVTGDALTHIAWKALAREQGLQVKQFSDQAGQQIWLDWHQLSYLSSEVKLAVLTRWVLTADSQKVHYGLRLPSFESFPDVEIPPSQGSAHRAKCLKALALFGLPQQQGERS